VVTGGAERDSETRCRNGPILTRCSIAVSWRTLAAAGDARARSDRWPVDVPANNPLHAMLADTSIAAPERIAPVAGPAFQWR
jgi:hypothetical protein